MGLDYTPHQDLKEMDDISAKLGNNIFNLFSRLLNICSSIHFKQHLKRGFRMIFAAE